MLIPDLDLARRFVAAHRPPGNPICVGLTGAHAYGFPSADSDLDLKGIHLAPLDALLGLEPPSQTHDRLEVFEGVECDLTTHEAAKALGLLLRGNGNVLEHITAPLQLYPTPELEELRSLVPGAVSRRFFSHYRGFFGAQCRAHANAARPTAKTLLYVYRIALTGARLLRTGEAVADLAENANCLGFEEAVELIAIKQSSTEKGHIEPDLDAKHRANWPRLEAELEAARAASPLPEEPRDPRALSSWLVRTRRRAAGIESDPR